MNFDLDVNLYFTCTCMLIGRPKKLQNFKEQTKVGKHAGAQNSQGPELIDFTLGPMIFKQ